MSKPWRLVMPMASITESFGDLAAAVDDNAKANMKQAAAHLEREIKVRAPVDTGHLRASYAYTVEEQGDTVIGHVGTNVPYAVHQEFGTTHQAGTPHVRPAIEDTRKQLHSIMGDGLFGGMV